MFNRRKRFIKDRTALIVAFEFFYIDLFLMTKPFREERIGAGNEIRTRDPNLGKVVLYH